MEKLMKQKHDEIIIREENGMLVMEIRMSKKLERKMAKLAEKTAGTIQAI